jgi:YHS domain-containing protein
VGIIEMSCATFGDQGGTIMFRDPDCGMDVDAEATEWWVRYHEETYYFCSLACLEEFERDPQRYLRARTAVADREG